MCRPKEIVSVRLTNKDRRYLNLALNVAMSSSERMKHGAVIVKGGRVLSVGINKFRNHPAIIESDMIKTSCSVHAEIDALRKIKDARGATIYVARVNKGGLERLSRPCDHCYNAIDRAGISKIIYT